MDVGARLHGELLVRGLTVATAESLTGGAVADLVSGTPGASATYVGGVVSYATAVKQQLLEVSQATVDRHGVVSARCAAEMANGVRKLLGADFAVSTTGVAGPDAQEGKPVGLVYVGVAGAAGVETYEMHLVGDRTAIRAEAARRAVEVLLEIVVRGMAAPGPGTATD
ncbi:MAG: CinA family protein [Nocardioides sp.]